MGSRRERALQLGQVEQANAIDTAVAEIRGHAVELGEAVYSGALVGWDPFQWFEIDVRGVLERLVEETRHG